MTEGEAPAQGPLSKIQPWTCQCSSCQRERDNGRLDLLLPAVSRCAVCGHGHLETPGDDQGKGCCRCPATGRFYSIPREVAHVR